MQTMPRPPRRFFPPLLLAAALSACGGAEAPPETPADLALACQIVACKCLGGRQSIFTDPQESAILWRENGDAYCPAGSTLQRVTPPRR